MCQSIKGITSQVKFIMRGVGCQKLYKYQKDQQKPFHILKTWRIWSQGRLACSITSQAWRAWKPPLKSQRQEWFCFCFQFLKASHQLDFKVLFTADQTNVFKQNPWLEPHASDGDHQPGLGQERRVGWVCWALGDMALVQGAASRGNSMAEWDVGLAG